jgi:DNA polymerase
MSRSINAPWQSLILADQAMGLHSVPSVAAPPRQLASPTADVMVEAPPRTAAADAPASTPAVAVIEPGDAPGSLEATHSLGIAASHAMQWGVVRPLPVSAAERAAALDEIKVRHDAKCPLCSTIKTYTQTVAGEGNPCAELFFVGEAPGEQEDLTGRPFVGRAGAKLDEMIKAMGLQRDQVFIANVLKSRPPNNRTPTPQEVAQCGPFLLEQLVVVRPKVIVTLGGPATKLLLGLEEGITRLRGIWASWHPPAGVPMEPIPVMPTFHPAYLLRNYTVETRAKVWSDLKMAMSRLTRR